MKQNPFTIVHGCVQDENTIRTVSFIDMLREKRSTASRLHKYTVSSESWGSYMLDWSAIAMDVSFKPELSVVAISEFGKTTIARASGDTQLDIADNGLEPMKWGPLRDLISTDTGYVAVGMSRQVYKLDIDSGWSLFDKGIQYPESIGEVCGFNSVCQTASGRFYAVGFYGEIWVNDGDRWERQDSPTNVVLHGVATGVDEDVYIVGQKGLLMRLVGDTFEVIPNDNTTDIWNAVVFQGNVYFCTEKQVYTLRGDEIVELETESVEKGYRTIDACEDRICVFGAKVILSSKDGRSWEEIAIVK